MEIATNQGIGCCPIPEVLINLPQSEPARTIALKALSTGCRVEGVRNDHHGEFKSNELRISGRLCGIFHLKDRWQPRADGQAYFRGKIARKRLEVLDFLAISFGVDQLPILVLPVEKVRAYYKDAQGPYVYLYIPIGKRSRSYIRMGNRPHIDFARYQNAFPRARS